MPIDASIYSQIRQPEQRDPIGQLARVLQVQGLQRQGQEYERSLAESNAQKEAVRGFGNDTTANYNRLLQTGDLKGAQAYQKSVTEQKKGNAESHKLFGEMLGQAATAVMAQPTEQNAIMQIEDFARKTGENADPLKALIYGFRGDPMKIKQWAGGRALSAKELLDKIETRDTGGQVQTLSTNPLTGQQSVLGQVAKTMTPGEIASNAVARGNLGVSQARLAMDQKEKDAGKWQYDATRGVQINQQTGQARDVTQGGKPIGAKDAAKDNARITDAKDVLSLLDEVDALLPRSTGSYAGAATDAVMGAFGGSTSGAQAVAQLKALQGALVSKMPKMSGPQSDKDVQLYREMAGQVGDQTIPIAQRQAAADLIRKLNEKYAGMEEGSSRKGRTSSGKVEDTPKPISTNSLEDPAKYKGYTMTDQQTGDRYVSDGKSWKRVK